MKDDRETCFERAADCLRTADQFSGNHRSRAFPFNRHRSGRKFPVAYRQRLFQMYELLRDVGVVMSGNRGRFRDLAQMGLRSPRKDDKRGQYAGAVAKLEASLNWLAAIWNPLETGIEHNC
jgi:hypothetical protein